jgi:transposase-like protein
VRRTASEKLEIIRLVEGTELPIRATLRQLGVPRSTFYGWYQRYVEQGIDGLHDKKPAPRPRWNAIPETVQQQVLDLTLERTAAQKGSNRTWNSAVQNGVGAVL